MTYTAEQLIATNQANVHALRGLTIHAYAGFQKLVELNLAASKAVFAESFRHTQALLGAKHPQQLVALQAGLVQPLTQKSIAYGRHVYTVVAETGTEFSNAFEAKLAQAQTAFAALVEDFSQNAPSGTESAVVLFKTAVNAQQERNRVSPELRQEGCGSG